MKKNIWTNFHRMKELFPQKIVSKLSKIIFNGQYCEIVWKSGIGIYNDLDPAK